MNTLENGPLDRFGVPRKLQLEENGSPIVSTSFRPVEDVPMPGTSIGKAWHGMSLGSRKDIVRIEPSLPRGTGLVLHVICSLWQ